MQAMPNIEDRNTFLKIYYKNYLERYMRNNCWCSKSSTEYLAQKMQEFVVAGKSVAKYLHNLER